MSESLTPISDPPDRSARWCPACGIWITNLRGRRRCRLCHTAVVRPMVHPLRPRPFELRPGVIAEFADPRDRYDPTRELAALRARLGARGPGGR
jgi:hypothetical protein